MLYGDSSRARSENQYRAFKQALPPGLKAYVLTVEGIILVAQKTMDALEVVKRFEISVPRAAAAEKGAN
jgi:hypothetical protein